MTALLTEHQRQKTLQSLPDWSYRNARGGLISREYQFRDFLQAFEFMRQMAGFSEALGHHPEWSNVYHRVNVILTTHDAGGLTDLDIAWANQADTVARSFNEP